jgi:hypothetical protein
MMIMMMRRVIVCYECHGLVSVVVVFIYIWAIAAARLLSVFSFIAGVGDSIDRNIRPSRILAIRPSRVIHLRAPQGTDHSIFKRMFFSSTLAD